MWLPLTIWIILCVAGFVYALFGRLPVSTWNASLMLVAGAAIVARLIPIILYPDPLGLIAIDIDNYAATARAVLDRRDVYELPLGTHPYPPLHMYVFAAAQWLADQLDASFFVLVRLPQAAADVGTALLVAVIVRDQRGEDDGFRFGLAYALCPLPILVTVYHGQFDAVSAFFAVLAFWALLRSASEPAFVAVSAAALALGTMEKMWPVLLLPVMLASLSGLRPRLTYAAVFTAVCAVLTAIYVVAFDSSVRTIFGAIRDYEPIFPTFAGLGLVLDRTLGNAADDFLAWFRENGTAMAAGIGLAAGTLAIAIRLTPARGIVLTLVAFLAATPASEPYHLMWLIPFALLAGDRVWPMAIVATSGVAYGMAMLLGAGMFIPPLDSSVADFLLDRRWALEYISWLVLVAWAAAILWAAFQARSRKRLQMA